MRVVKMTAKNTVLELQNLQVSKLLKALLSGVPLLGLSGQDFGGQICHDIVSFHLGLAGHIM